MILVAGATGTIGSSTVTALVARGARVLDLRRERTADGVSVLWGLEPMIDLVAASHLTAAQAHEVADRIHQANPLFITVEIVRRFANRVNAAAPKKHR